MNQLLATMSTLKQSIDTCPEKEWNERHGDYPFSQVVFHALFFTDYYLSENEEEFLAQEFHKTNTSLFTDYEELENKIPEHLYTVEQINGYLKFCITKIRSKLANEGLRSLSEESGFKNRRMSKMELYIYVIRHIQHHAAQLGLRVQQLTGRELVWIRSGWKDIDYNR